MDYLRAYAEQYGLAAIIEQFAEKPGVQGVILRVDELWLQAWRAKESGDEAWSERFRRFMNWRRGPVDVIASEWLYDVPWIPGRIPDLNWRPQEWDELCYVTGRSESAPPIRVVISLLPSTLDVDRLPTNRIDTRIPLIFEVRPQARLASVRRSIVRPLVGGLSVGAGASAFGTLGGILKDGADQRYASTCAHVISSSTAVEQPARHDNARSLVIGHQVRAIPLQPCGRSGPCSPYSPSSHISAVDTALVDIDPSVPSRLEQLVIGALAGTVPKSQMTVGQIVEFEGRTAGRRQAEIGGLVVFYRFHHAGLAYCFKDLFEIRWPWMYQALFRPVIRPGDSGAWVCSETAQGPAWCGQVIGEDRRVGYAAFAENILGAWSAQQIALHVS